MSNRTQEEWHEFRQKWAAQTGPFREMLMSPQGVLFREHLKSLVYGRQTYVPGSFDATAYNLGMIALYQEIEVITKGLNDG